MALASPEPGRPGRGPGSLARCLPDRWPGGSARVWSLPSPTAFLRMCSSTRAASRGKDGGSSGTFTRRRTRRGRVGDGPWHRHGPVPQRPDALPPPRGAGHQCYGAFRRRSPPDRPGRRRARHRQHPARRLTTHAGVRRGRNPASLVLGLSIQGGPAMRRLALILAWESCLAGSMSQQSAKCGLR